MKKTAILVMALVLISSCFIFTACTEKEPCRDFGAVCKEECVDNDFHIENAECEPGLKCCYAPLK